MKRRSRLTLLSSLINAGVLAFALNAGASVLTQKPPGPTPSPTPRRSLPQPVGGTRGFDQYAKRESSSRLIIGAATRGATDPASILYQKGGAAYAGAKYHQSVKDFSEAVRLRPDWAAAHYALALSLAETQQLKEAIEEFKRVLKLKAKYELMVLSNYNMGNAFFDLGQYKEAIEAHKQAIELYPELSKPHNNLGLAYAASDRLAEAVAEFNQAVQLGPDNAAAHFNLGVAYLQLSRTREAEEQQCILVKLDHELATKLDALIRK